jgi:hypothetical protein
VPADGHLHRARARSPAFFNLHHACSLSRPPISISAVPPVRRGLLHRSGDNSRQIRRGLLERRALHQ